MDGPEKGIPYQWPGGRDCSTHDLNLIWDKGITGMLGIDAILSRRHIQAVVAALIRAGGKSSTPSLLVNVTLAPDRPLPLRSTTPSREAISGGISARGYQHRQIIAGESCNLKSIEMAA